MAKQQEKYEALILRKKGTSIGAIAKKLNVSKSTVSFWCKDINLSPQQIEAIAESSKHHATAALLQSSERQRIERQETIAVAKAQGEANVGTLSKRDTFMIGLGLYWGEGYKKGSQELGFTNSDPSMIEFYIKWLHDSFAIDKQRLILRVSINQYHKDRVQEVLQYWSKLLDIPLSQFTKTSLIKSVSKKQKFTEKHYGTLRVKVRRGTLLRHQILGSISCLK